MATTPSRNAGSQETHACRGIFPLGQKMRPNYAPKMPPHPVNVEGRCWTCSASFSLGTEKSRTFWDVNERTLGAGEGIEASICPGWRSATLTRLAAFLTMKKASGRGLTLGMTLGARQTSGKKRKL